MSAPCEFAVKYLYPIVRSELARFLIKRFKLTQIQTAERLGITQAAISQYTSLKRGGNIKSVPESVQRIIKESLEELCSANRVEEISAKHIEETVCSICRRIKSLEKNRLEA